MGKGDVVDEAIAWHLRRNEMSGDDWLAFVVWLEASPLHARIYDNIALKHGELCLGAQDVVPANDNRKRWVRRSAAAVAAVLLAGIGFALMPASDPYAVATQEGERRTIALGDGTRIELNGATRLTLDHNNMRVASLQQGEATFHVRHDDGQPFTLHAGPRVIEDVGTVFNVSREVSRLDVQVAEGAVIFEPGKQAIRLTPGSALTVTEQDKTVRISHVPAATVGSWRRGTLYYYNVPLSAVRDALQRSYGDNLALSDDLSQRSFTGMVRLTGDEKRDIPHFAALIGADWRHDGTRWTLSPKITVAR
jgi:transmembrane sensor